MKKIRQGLLIVAGLLLLSSCATQELMAPCDAYGKNCDPKIPINQWTPQ